MGGRLVIHLWILISLFEGFCGQAQSSTQNLEYVMTVLKQRGLLDKVDPSLLSRVQSVVDKQKENDLAAKQSGALQDLSTASTIKDLSSTSSVQDHVQSQKIFQQLPKSNNKRTRSQLFETRERGRKGKLSGLFSNECDNIRAENRLLKQLLALQSNKEATSRVDTFEQPQLIQQQFSAKKLRENSRTSLVSTPLSKLLPQKPQGKFSEQRALGNELNAKSDNLIYKSILVTPTPIISTIVRTTSYEATVTQNITREIPLIVRGQRVMTTLIDPTISVITTTEILSRTSTITFEPTFQVLTITPTTTPQPPVQFHKPIKPIILSNNNGIREVQPFGGFQAQVVEIPRSPETFKSLQNILSKLQINQGIKPLLAAVSERSSVSETLKPVPSITTKILTLYLSGSKPGEYSTRLTTLVVDEDGQQIERKKREVLKNNGDSINPTGVLSIQTSKRQNFNDTSDVNDLTYDHPHTEIGEIQGSLNIPKQTLQLASTVTVTVTEQINECTPILP